MKDGKVSSSRRLVILDVELLAMVVERKGNHPRRRFISGVWNERLGSTTRVGVRSRCTIFTHGEISL